MFRKAAICAVAFVGASLTEAAKLQQEISKRDGAHGHDHAHAAAPAAPASGYSAPASSYSAPAASYGAPAASYGAPAASYGAPAPSYEEPAPSYGAPAPSYGAPVSYEEDQPGFFPDVTFIIVGILIVVGLSLLFPTYVSLTTVRRKRDVAEASRRFKILAKSSKLPAAAMQLSKLLWAAAFIAGAAASGHHIHKRDTPRPAYPKVSRDSEYGAPIAPSFSSSGSSYSSPPASSYSAPAPAPSYSAPAPSYSAPAPSYSAPASSYSAPSTSYAAPSSSYGAPAASYGAPEVSYGGTVYEEDTGKGIDLTSIIIPILALIGLSLLFPTYVSLTTVRKKRSGDQLEEEVNPMYNLVERVSDIYNSVVQSETCMERIACEVGGLAGDMGIKETTRLAEPFVPSKYKNYVKQFTAGRDCHKIKCGSLAF